MLLSGYRVQRLVVCIDAAHAFLRLCHQGVFLECRWSGARHYYHKLCGLVPGGGSAVAAGGAAGVLCPHCGSSDSPHEVLLSIQLVRKPIVYLEQHQEKKAL